MTTDRTTKILLAVIAGLLATIALRLVVTPSVSPSTANQTSPTAQTAQTGRYQFVRQNESNAFIIDTATGRSWRTFVETNSGPGDWVESDPVSSTQAGGKP